MTIITQNNTYVLRREAYRTFLSGGKVHDICLEMAGIDVEEVEIIFPEWAIELLKPGLPARFQTAITQDNQSLFISTSIIKEIIK